MVGKMTSTLAALLWVSAILRTLFTKYMWVSTLSPAPSRYVSSFSAHSGPLTRADLIGYARDMAKALDKVCHYSRGLRQGSASGPRRARILHRSPETRDGGAWPLPQLPPGHFWHPFNPVPFNPITLHSYIRRPEVQCRYRSRGDREILLGLATSDEKTGFCPRGND